MPIGTSDGVYYEDDFKFSSNQGQSVIKPTEDQMKDNNELHPESIPTPEMLSQMEFSAQSRANFLSEAPQGAPQDASQSAINDRTRVLEGPEVSTYQAPENNAPVTGVRETIRQGAQAVRDATGIGQESFVKDFLTKLGNSKEYLDLYFEGKVDYNDPNLVHAVTTLASTAGSAGLASAPLRTSSIGTFGGTLAFKKMAVPESVQNFADAIMKHKEGALPSETFKSTGWWIDPRDGMWKFEISDEHAALKSTKVAEGVLELMHKEVPSAVQGETTKVSYWGPSTTETKLEDILDHPSLYYAYPELKKLPVVYEKDATTPLFTRPDEKGTIPYITVDKAWMNNKSKEGKIRTLLHEIQHWIQEKENFGRGSDSQKVAAGEDYWSAPGEIESRNVEERYSSAVRGRRTESPVQTANPAGYNDNVLAILTQGPR